MITDDETSNHVHIPVEAYGLFQQISFGIENFIYSSTEIASLGADGTGTGSVTAKCVGGYNNGRECGECEINILLNEYKSFN